MMMTLMLVQFRTRRLHANGLDSITIPPTIPSPIHLYTMCYRLFSGTSVMQGIILTFKVKWHYV